MDEHPGRCCINIRRHRSILLAAAVPTATPVSYISILNIITTSCWVLTADAAPAAAGCI
jgi:hypothetical protein